MRPHDMGLAAKYKSGKDGGGREHFFLAVWGSRRRGLDGWERTRQKLVTAGRKACCHRQSLAVDKTCIAGPLRSVPC